MVPFEMSVDARMMLAKMSLSYEKERGARIHMSRDEDIVRLINYAVDSSNDEVIKQYESFCRMLTPYEIKELAAQGANIYRGALVNPVEDEAPEGMTPGTRTYRGTVVEDTGLDSAVAAKPAGKGKRVYRGRVIEE